ncbi:hypothetical protein AVEN_120083-1 [Araneus ventricosus]|uniref:Uncharacterized protein n=1 Tax=Araneus ventricosus TaxID=182803 RepID=A0A4Y2G2R6_ARAVE|nr:hypothetical protein AVEN_120083-1 [Araneus ventricosus]
MEITKTSQPIREVGLRVRRDFFPVGNSASRSERDHINTCVFSFLKRTPLLFSSLLSFIYQVTLAPLDKDCTVAPEENEVSPSTSQIYVSILSIMPLSRHEQRGAKTKRKSQKSEIMTSSPFKNLLGKKEKVELEEAKANRDLKKNKNGDKTEKGKALSKEKTHSEFYRKPGSLNKFEK